LHCAFDLLFTILPVCCFKLLVLNKKNIQLRYPIVLAFLSDLEPEPDVENGRMLGYRELHIQYISITRSTSCYCYFQFFVTCRDFQSYCMLVWFSQKQILVILFMGVISCPVLEMWRLCAI